MLVANLLLLVSGLLLGTCGNIMGRVYSEFNNIRETGLAVKILQNDPGDVLLISGLPQIIEIEFVTLRRFSN